MNHLKNTPTIFVVYGATGDLMARKIAPSLFNLYKKHLLPDLFQVVGVARRNISDTAFQTYVLRMIKNQLKEKDMNSFKSFCRLFTYHQGRFEDKTLYRELAKKLGYIDNNWNVCSNKLFYLAVPPIYYEGILKNLHASHLADPCSFEEGWTRVLVEKPFGTDLSTAKKLDKILSNLFKEEQIYRIDHYLGKEMMQNILAFRFSNNFLEQSWNNAFIQRIDIYLLEDNDVSNRGEFYEGMGALRDVGQNHLLQMLALVTMDNPVMMTANAIRRRRAEVLQTIKAPSLEEVKKDTIRAQYDTYTQHKNVSKNSQVETYFKVRVRLLSSRWEGVPIYIISGKGFPRPDKKIVVTFRNPQKCLTCKPGEDYHNQVRFSLEPEESISIGFFSKKPGLSLQVQKKELHFRYRSQKKKRQYVEEYEKLLLDCIQGDQTLFVSSDEVLPMWKFTDAIISSWRKNKVPLHKYKKGTDAILKLSTKDEHLSFAKKKWSKEVAIVGLGKMGGGMALQLVDHGWKVYGFNRTRKITENYERKGIHGVYSFSKFLTLAAPRVIILSLPAGKTIDEVLFGSQGLENILSKEDIIIDAGNSFYKDTIRREKILRKKGIHYIDVGISGGPSGARFGACLMIGGSKKLFTYLEPLFSDIALPNGYAFFNGVGAGHFVKMVHNGIEYGMMQAIAEGFTLLKKGPFRLDTTQVARIYNNGSVIESRLIGWLYDAYKEYGIELKKISGKVAHSGEGLWTVKTAKEFGIETRIIRNALEFRIRSQNHPSYTGKVVSALRGQFGGHKVEDKK